MAYAGGAGAGVAAAAAAIAQAIKASGAIVKVEPDAFTAVLRKIKEPLVVMSKGGIMKPNYQYLTALQGANFLHQVANTIDSSERRGADSVQTDLDSGLDTGSPG